MITDRQKYNSSRARDRILRLLKRARLPRTRIEETIEKLEEIGTETAKDNAAKIQAVLDEIIEQEQIIEDNGMGLKLEVNTGSLTLHELAPEEAE